MGEALEEYIKDAFAETIGEDNNEIRKEKIKKCFSYFGNQNNPPDCIIANGDAIEVKKTENTTSDLALNSSYPKAKLYTNSPMISKECRECEKWTEKDILYACGVCKDKKLSLLSFVYGINYAAKIEKIIKINSKSFILDISDIEIKNPDNPAKYKNAKLIKFAI